ncbi:MAG: DUF3301 domain-containing protein [Burkholderiales bacterium]|nr:DUF3301 domain-containing protein [Burkholderiales bacterium]
MAAARAACEAEGLQFLDDTVAIQSVRPARDSEGAVCLRRLYGFEYSDTGERRYPGHIVMLGAEVVVVRIGAGGARTPLRIVR